jgi:nicotinate-nucleotide adenylyltransferase
MARVGLFGGTFNPVHLAHLRAAEEVAEARALDRVDFVLAAVPPHKPGADLAPVADRLRMLELALADNPRFAVNTCEVERGGRSYSVDTIRICRDREPGAAFAFILGADAFAEIESWKDFAEIFALCDLCVISRPGAGPARPPIAVENAFCYDPGRGVYTHRSGHSLELLPVTALMISASDIRHRRAAGRSTRYLVPAAVDDYMSAHDLYAGRAAAR